MATKKIDQFWVLGEKTQPPFDRLTVQERQLLKWRYVDGKRSSQISQTVNEHPNTIREHLSKIKEKIRNTIHEEDMQEYLFLMQMEKM